MSPLLNTYLLVIITSELALGKLATVLEMALIFVCVLLLGDFTSADGSFSMRHIGGAASRFSVATCIQAELRTTDVLARYGGDEFIALLPETPSRAAVDVGQRIRKAVAASPIEFSGRSIATTVSIGVAAYPESGATIDALIGRADRAMYTVKQAGRDGVANFSA